MPLVTDDPGNPPAPRLPKRQFTLDHDDTENVINPYGVKGIKSAKKYICSVGKCSGVDV